MMNSFRAVASTTSISLGSTSACSTTKHPNRSFLFIAHGLQILWKCPICDSNAAQESEARWGENRYQIWTPRGCQTKQATVLSDMSLGLHFDCRPFPWCGGLVHLHLARKASATLRKLIWFAIRRAISISGWHVSKLQLNGFRNWCERCKRGVHCRCPPPLSQPKGYRSYLPQMATCPRNNRQLMNLLETNRFEYLHIMMINLVPSCTCAISNYILTLIFAVIYPEGAMVCMTCSEDFGIGKQKQQ